MTKHKLNDFQKNAFEECMAKGSGGLSLPMGSGKTFLGLSLALKYHEIYQTPSLIVAAKSLIPNWLSEIEKFFGDSLDDSVAVWHFEHIKKLEEWTMKPETKIIITTPEVMRKWYTNREVANLFVSSTIINEGEFGQHTNTIFERPDKPFRPMKEPKGPGMLFHLKWAAIFVDEVQRYSNSGVDRCRAMAAVCAHHRWMLSGTMFCELKTQIILGYYLMINHPTFPRTIPETAKLLKSDRFEGFRESCVFREKNENFDVDAIGFETHVVDFKMLEEEEKAYLSIKKIMKKIQTQVKEFRHRHLTESTRKFSSYLLASVTMLKQSLVVPMLPIASATMDFLGYKDVSDLSRMVYEEIKDVGLDDWLNDPEAVFSTRMWETKKVIESKPDEQVIVFTSFRSCLDIYRKFVEREFPDRPIFTIESTMSSITRGDMVERFRESKNGIFLLTYLIGGEGLNLQTCHNVLLLDYWWNSSVINQAIARSLRPGQTQKVHAWFFTSHTGIENSIFKKSGDKFDAIKEFETGKVTTRLKGMKLDEILRMMDDENENKNVLTTVNQKTIKT